MKNQDKDHSTSYHDTKLSIGGQNFGEAKNKLSNG